MRRLANLAALVVALAAASGCGGSDGGGGTPDASLPIDALAPDAAPRETIMENMLLVPGELAEGIMTSGPGDLAVIHLAAPSAAIDWNIHGHAGGGTQIVHEEFDQQTVDYVFAPSAAADWFLLVRNGGATDVTVQIKVELHGNTQWRWQ